jgi:hypothetical protein
MVEQETERVCNCGLKESEHNVRHPFIPRLEPKQEREPYWDLVDKKAEQNNTIDLDAYAKGIQDGAKWQQERMYSEEEVKRICSKAWLKTPNTPNMLEEFDKWFEQFKKK